MTFENILIHQIDWSLDEYLSYVKSEEAELNNIIANKNIYVGSFSAPETDELLVLFHINSPHSASLDRTIAAVYDKKTLDVITQKTFIGDMVKIHILPSEDIDYILYLGSVTYTGVSTYYIELYKIQERQWIENEIDDLQIDPGKSYHYALASNNELHIFSRVFRENPFDTIFRYEYTLYWENGSFRKDN